jgi:hypothetical protein
MTTAPTSQTILFTFHSFACAEEYEATPLGAAGAGVCPLHPNHRALANSAIEFASVSAA